MNYKRAFALGGLAILAAVLQPAQASVVNGGFETADFQNWRVNIPRGNIASGNTVRLAGSAQITTAWGTSSAMSPLRVALEGSQFAILSSVANAHFTGSRAYNLTLTRQVHLIAGETISGAAAFHGGNTDYRDSAWVNILNEDGLTIARPWEADSNPEYRADGFNLTNSTPATWTRWSWSATTTGNYTIGLGLTTRGDDYTPSYGFFDDICIRATQTTPIPEPSALSIIVLGVAGLTTFRRNFNPLATEPNHLRT